MSDGGATTVGSIVGKLKLDIADWVAKTDLAKAKVEELRAEDPKVKVDANVGEALTKLESVKVAARDVGNESTKAGKQAQSAAGTGINWMGVLVGAIASVAPGMVAVGAAAIGLSAELGGLGAAGLLAFQGIQAGIAANLPMFAGLNDALDSVGSTLTTLEMTAAGGLLSGLSSGLRTLQGDIAPITSMVGLLATQLGGMLATAVDTTVHAVNGFSPVITAAGSALQGFLNGIDQFTQSNGFTDFVNYTVARLPDVMHLLNDALGAVGKLFSNLAPGGQAVLFLLSSLVDLIGALAPVLGALMPAFIGVADTLGGVALAVAAVLNVLGPLGPLVTIAATAFFAWGTIGPIVASVASALETAGTAIYVAGDAAGFAGPLFRLLGVAIDSALGPIGLIVLALSLVVGAFAAMDGGAKSLASSTADLTSALQEDSGAVGENVKALTAHQLITDGAAAAGAKFGLNLKTMTDAATGNAAAQTKVNTALAETTPRLNNAAAAHSRFHGAMSSSEQAANLVRTAISQQNSELTKATDQYNKVAVATGNAKMSTQQMAAAAAAVNMPVGEFAAAAAAQDKAASAAQALRDKYILAGDAANLLKLDMDNLNGATISNAEAQAAWASGIDSLATSFNKKSKAITGDTNAAIENRGAVASLVSVGETAIQSYANQTHSVSKTTAEYKSMRAELINQISAITGNRKAATALVDQYFKIPKNIKTDFKGNDADAKAKAASARKAADDFAKGKYQASFKADPSEFKNRLTATLAAGADFSRKQWTALLKADPSAAQQGARLAQSAINGVTGKSVNILVTTKYYTVGKSEYGGGNIYTGGKTGGTAGSTAFGSVNAIKGMASGGSPGGTISGAGAASSDMAGLYRLANGEEVISNLFGQADKWRPLLKAINAGKVDYRTFEKMAAHSAGSNRNARQTTIAPEIHIHNPVAVDPIQQTVEAAQLTLAYAGLG